MEFTKSDLKNGMVIEYRNKDLRLVLGEKLITLDSCNELSHYNENLINTECPFDDLDIMKVYNAQKANTIKKMLNKNYLTLIWQREEKTYPILTKYQYELLKKLNEDFNWIARSDIGELHLYTGNIMPYKKQGWGCWYWEGEDGARFCLFDCLDDFDFVKWEDEEPWNIKELIENCEVE